MPPTKQTARKSTGGRAPRKQLVIEEAPKPSFDHVLFQTQRNVEHLIAHSQIPQDDGLYILEKLGVGSPTTSTSSHIVSQTRQNIELLVAHDQILEDDGRDILAKLFCASSPSGTSVSALAEEASHLSISSGVPIATGVMGVALMHWRSEGVGDLNLRAGDIIEILQETDEDWWTGRNQAGKQGTFPSVYVKKIGQSSDEED
ncbi:SH3 domain-containing protein [Pisolithus albus]|nr:SH3 domain-containing protein [Pisolithus albus]